MGSGPKNLSFGLLFMADVEKSEILQNVKKCQTSPHDRCEEIWVRYSVPSVLIIVKSSSTIMLDQ